MTKRFLLATLATAAILSAAESIQLPTCMAQARLQNNLIFVDKNDLSSDKIPFISNYRNK